MDARPTPPLFPSESPRMGRIRPGMMPAFVRLRDESRDPAQGASEGGGRIANGTTPGTSRVRSNRFHTCRTCILVAWLAIADSLLLLDAAKLLDVVVVLRARAFVCSSGSSCCPRPAAVSILKASSVITVATRSKVRRKNERNPLWPEAGKGARYLQQPIRRHRWGAHGRSAC
jgi:hypothetical protein